MNPLIVLLAVFSLGLAHAQVDENNLKALQDRFQIDVKSMAEIQSQKGGDRLSRDSQRSHLQGISRNIHPMDLNEDGEITGREIELYKNKRR